MNVDEALKRVWIAALVGWEGWSFWLGYTLLRDFTPSLFGPQQTRWQIIDEAVFMGAVGLALALVIAWVWRGFRTRSWR